MHLQTDPFYSCTKELFCIHNVDYTVGTRNSIALYDTPGIGEFPDNSRYQLYYNHAVAQADCIVLVVTFARTDAPEQELLLSVKQMLPQDREVRFIIALNRIDSTIVAMNDGYKSWDEAQNRPSSECCALIEERIAIIHEKFDGLFLPFEVVHVCAMRNYGIDNLKNTLINI